MNVVMNGGYLNGYAVNNMTVVPMFKCEMPIVMSIFLRITRESTLQPPSGALVVEHLTGLEMIP